MVRASFTPRRLLLVRRFLTGPRDSRVDAADARIFKQPALADHFDFSRRFTSGVVVRRMNVFLGGIGKARRKRGF